MHAAFHEHWLERGARWFGPALFVLSLGVFWWTLCPGAYPGEPARLIAQHAGLDPFPPMSNPVWGRVVKFLALFPFAGFVRRLNLFSALCGAGSVWLLYALVSRIPHDRTAEEIEARVPSAAPQTLSGLVAALFLAFSIPFWFVSTRAHTASFDLFLLLFSTWVLARFSAGRTPSLMYLYAFLYGLGMTEFATFILLAPIFGLWLLAALWRAGQLRARPILGMALAWAAGLLMYGVAAAEYRLSPAYEWRAFTSFFQVLWFIWRDQYLAIRFSVPQVGWMLMFMICVFPALVLAFPKKAMTRTAVWGSNLMHLLFGAVALMVLFNVQVSPWALFGLRPLLVTPYLLVALWAGYVAGYWLIYFSPYNSFAPRRSILRRAGRLLLVPLLLAALVAAAARNAPEADGRANPAARRFAEETLDGLNGRTWLVSNGILDDLIRIAARERGIPLKLLNPGWGRSSAYLNYTASLFDDPRLKGLATVGLSPLLQEWLGRTPGAAQGTVVLAHPDIWMAAGLEPVPERLGYVGVTNTAALDPDAYLREQKAFWSAYGQALLDEEKQGRKLLAPWTTWALAHLSRSANNAGVLLENQGRSDAAFEAYQAARRMNTNNVSALLNGLALAMREGRAEAGEWERDLTALARRMRRRLPLWALAPQFGYVRTPELFAARGMAWAMSGKPDLAVAELRRAAEAGAPRAQIELALGTVFALQQMGEESGRRFAAVLEQQPGNIPALLGMARLAMQRRDFETAAGYLNQARAHQAPENVVLMDEALLDALAGRAEESKRKLLDLVKQDPRQVRAWTVLALVAVGEGDEETLTRCLTALQSAALHVPTVRLPLAQIALIRRDAATARSQLEELLKMQPDVVPALEMLIRLDLAEGKRTEMESRIERLLTVDSRNAEGNYALGLIQYTRGALDLAEASFRTSLAGRRTDSVLNDLAWILQLRGRYDEAEKLVRESLDMNPNNATAWDTLGVILFRTDRISEAEGAIQRALALLPTYPHFILHMAEIYERRGLREEALQLADPLLARAAEMSPDAYEQLRRLIKRLRR